MCFDYMHTHSLFITLVLYVTVDRQRQRVGCVHSGLHS